jgi:hypothetical protein
MCHLFFGIHKILRLCDSQFIYFVRLAIYPLCVFVRLTKKTPVSPILSLGVWAFGRLAQNVFCVFVSTAIYPLCDFVRITVFITIAKSIRK